METGVKHLRIVDQEIAERAVDENYFSGKIVFYRNYVSTIITEIGDAYLYTYILLHLPMHGYVNEYSSAFTWIHT